MAPKLEGVYEVLWGATCHVYEINPLIVVKVPDNDEQAKENFRNELKIMDILTRHPSPYLITCFLHTDKGIFLEYMRDMSLEWRLQRNVEWDERHRQVLRVNKIEPLSLRKRWMNDLAQAVAFLETLNLAHGDIRPGNVLLDRDRIKLGDFDCTGEFGSSFETCGPPYGRILGDEAGPERGQAGSLGPRTEQFALGSLYYLINYGFEPYDDQCLGGDPTHKNHGPTVVDLLQNMKFPELNGDPEIDLIIKQCWHAFYERLADLAADVKRLYHADVKNCGDGIAESDPPALMPEREFLSRRKICEEFVESGLLDTLASGNRQSLKLSMSQKYKPSDEPTQFQLNE
ncbi:hypothetical protein PRK78_005514 [Emydomyces testavorans]|uniref:Protein kinase domain-containing protein n=1 Tax=Emydomyces testavorans TaxID=2070801 RepID=A0AAF0DJR0_9EURO|nr:hypothetical protein PRK78_005514 [Emydomyces testavorans]